MIEAIYQSLCKKKVLVIDNEASIGGAWKSLDFDKFTNVENAVHYLLPNNEAISFLQDVLKKLNFRKKNQKMLYLIYLIEVLH